MMQNYEVVFTDNKEINNSFKDEASFIEWVFSDKKRLENNFSFKSENNIDIKRVEALVKFLKYYIGVKKTLDEAMDSYNNSILEISENKEIKKALLEFVRMNDSGKFLRAMLIALGYNTCGNKDDNYTNLALALEIFQTAILIHDDIIDSAVVRRGKDTIPVSYEKMFDGAEASLEFKNKLSKFADSMALCIADMGFYLAEELIVKGYKESTNLADILSYYHNVAIKTCHGEMLDVTIPFKEEYFKGQENLEENILEIYRLKTAWYSVVGPFCLGLTLGNCDNNVIKKMENILMNVGVAFQIKDDLLGIYGDEDLLGKSTNSDIEEYKQTILYSYVMNTKYSDELLKYYGKSGLSIDEVNKVKDIFNESGAKKYAEDMMNTLFKKSIEELSSINLNEEYKSILFGFIVYLQNRSK